MPSAGLGLRLWCRFIITLAVLALLPLSPIHGQDWGSKMFDVKEIDFGVVPRGAEAAFYLNVRNLYKEEIQLKQFDRSAGLLAWRDNAPIALPSAQQRKLTLLADTILYSGNRKTKASVTLYDATNDTNNVVEFPVKILIRTDVEVKSGDANFGVVEQGATAERKLVLQAIGNDKWQITRATIKNPEVTVVATETGRENGTVTYELVVSLKPTAAFGPIRDHITITTNEPVNSKLSIAVEGQVEPPRTGRHPD